ncbi:Endonuclease/exonuclease/phosphatase [Artemisia annua]|uniref:Endonuclease/exonuclease/phosphatase n=1 Tax=Artemisia annua TaxID=35608 RepID=A0A2U1MYG0_ARTAN|nr:Endonuclease/exonuclease/phosphatase [Artemisia annua]
MFGRRPSDCPSSHRPSDFSSTGHRPSGLLKYRPNHYSASYRPSDYSANYRSSDYSGGYRPSDYSACHKSRSFSPMLNCGTNCMEDGCRTNGNSSYCLVASKQMVGIFLTVWGSVSLNYMARGSKLPNSSLLPVSKGASGDAKLESIVGKDLMEEKKHVLDWRKRVSIINGMITGHSKNSRRPNCISISRDSLTDGSEKYTMTSMSDPEPVVSLTVSPVSKDSTIIAHDFIKCGLLSVTSDSNPVLIKQGIDKMVLGLIEELKKRATPVKGAVMIPQYQVESQRGAAAFYMEAKKGMAGAGKANTTPLKEKAADGKTFIYATKQQVEDQVLEGEKPRDIKTI